MNKEKLNSIKNKIKQNAPVIVAFSVTFIGIIAVAKKSADSFQTSGTPVLIFHDNGDGFPEVTGEERDNILGSENKILNRLDDQNYILTVVSEDV